MICDEKEQMTLLIPATCNIGNCIRPLTNISMSSGSIITITKRRVFHEQGKRFFSGSRRIFYGDG